MVLTGTNVYLVHQDILDILMEAISVYVMMDITKMILTAMYVPSAIRHVKLVFFLVKDRTADHVLLEHPNIGSTIVV